MRTTVLAALFASLVFTNTTIAGSFKVGFSNVALTPLPVGVTAHLMTTGLEAEPGNYPDGYDLGLTVRAVYIANANGAPQPVVLVSADLINLCAADADFARDPSHYGDPNLTRERILISITHTHTAPAACDTSMRVQGTQDMRDDADYDSTWRVHVRDKLREAIDLAVTRAGEPGSKASLRFARSKFDVGMNRRTNSTADLTSTDGTTLNNANGYDQTLDVVEVRGDDGARKGVLFFYGMHPVNLSFFDFPSTPDAPCRSTCPAPPSTGLRYFHPDSPGFARRQIESATEEDDVAIFFQAAGGNVNPATCWRYCGALATGLDLGDKVLSMLEEGAPNAIAGDITASTNDAYNRVWAAPLQTAAGDDRIGGTPREMRGNSFAAIGIGYPASGAWGLWASYYCEDFTGHGGGNPPCEKKDGLLLDRSQDMEFQTLTIGNWRVAALSHEPVTSWGLKLRQNWPGDWVTAVGYTNREHNYLPTSAHLDADDACAVANFSSCAGYEGYVAQLLNGNPASWATRALTASSTTGATYDLDAELAHVFTMKPLERVNYANRWHGSEATASSTSDPDLAAYAAINGDRKGMHWGSDPETGSGWQDDTSDAYPDEIVVDFKTPRTIDEIDVFTAQDDFDITPPVEPTKTMTCLEYGIVDFEVQYWESSRWPARWITIATVTNNDKVWRKFTFPPLTTMKIRVVISDAREHWSRIAEIEAWGNATSRPNVALASNGATALASSELDANRTALAAINGDRKGIHWGSDPATGSGWHDATSDDFTDDRLQVTFAGPRRINEINVFSVQDNWTSPSTPTETMTCTVVGLIDFQVQYKNGAVWTVVPGGNVTSNNLCWRKFTFVPIETSQIRVVVTNGANHYSRIAEVEALTPYDFLSSVEP